MKRTTIYMIIALLSLPVLASAAEASVDYLEGILEVQVSGSWQEVSIGDEISPSARLRLSDEGYAELLVGDTVISLTRDGTYTLNDLIKGSASVGNTSLDFTKKITLSSGNEKWKQEATMGVRGAEAAVTDSAAMEDAFTYLDAGLKSLDKSDYKEALINFEEGWEYFEDQNCLFFAAVCYDALGQKRSYTKSLQEIQLTSLEPDFQSAFVIRMSDLLIRSLAYKEAVEMISSFEGKSVSLTKEEDQQIQYLKGTALLGSGNKQNARNAFKKAFDIAPSTPLGEQASKALSSL